MQKPVQIVYSHTAEKEISKLPRTIAKKILKKIVENAAQTDVLVRAKALTGQFSGAYRYRVGEYRVIFLTNDYNEIVVLTVVSVKHRKDIYRK